MAVDLLVLSYTVEAVLAGSRVRRGLPESVCVKWVHGQPVRPACRVDRRVEGDCIMHELPTTVPSVFQQLAPPLPSPEKIPGSTPACSGIFLGSSHSSYYPARRLVL